MEGGRKRKRARRRRGMRDKQMNRMGRGRGKKGTEMQKHTDGNVDFISRER